MLQLLRLGVDYVPPETPKATRRAIRRASEKQVGLLVWRMKAEAFLIPAQAGLVDPPRPAEEGCRASAVGIARSRSIPSRTSPPGAAIEGAEDSPSLAALQPSLGDTATAI